MVQKQFGIHGREIWVMTTSTWLQCTQVTALLSWGRTFDKLLRPPCRLSMATGAGLVLSSLNSAVRISCTRETHVSAEREGRAFSCGVCAGEALLRCQGGDGIELRAYGNFLVVVVVGRQTRKKGKKKRCEDTLRALSWGYNGVRWGTRSPYHRRMFVVGVSRGT